MARKSLNKPRRRGVQIAVLFVALVAGAVGVVADESAVVPTDVRGLLEQMSDYLAAYEEFSFDAEVTMDDVTIGIHRIQTTDKIEAVVRRPNKLWITEHGDFMNKRFWYDGKTVSILSLVDLFYATAKVPNTIDGALDTMADKYGATTPVVDFLVSNPYESLMERAKGGVYAGLHEVDGVYCHHLSFIQDDLDWQIWIEDGKRFVPRKFSVTYKNDAGSPRVVTVFKSWDFSAKHSDSFFEFKPPDNARKIEFLPLTQM